MNLLVQSAGLALTSLPARPVHLAIGMFDGVHLGHRSVIEAAVQSAKRCGGIAAVLTFAPHPSVLLRPANATPLIMDIQTKAAWLQQLGVELLIVEPFTPNYAKLAAEEFLPHLRSHLPLLAAVYVGENWRFGQARRGDVALLITEGHRLEIGVFSAPRVNLDGEPISSTRIRTLLSVGDVVNANRLLGHTYSARGVITAGKRLGRTIGFPTLNLAWSPELRPKLGVYAVRVLGSKSALALCGVANYGLRPTVEQSTQPLLETHILGNCPFDEGDEITVEWLRFLRSEMKFAGLEPLQAQIAQDVIAARAEFFLP
ncbi:MAG: riboflavin biosynthesis protein RibF [Opitutaceae bacterium]